MSRRSKALHGNNWKREISVSHWQLFTGMYFRIRKAAGGEKALLQVAFTHRISTKAENVCRVIRVQDKLKQEEQIPLVKGIAYVSCYTDAYEIF